MSRIIPETVNELGMAEAFRFYRDELKLHVYPVDGPWSKKADPGKKPSVKAWWNYDPKECGVAEFFKPQRCHNIGVCPTKHLYIVDLDSKTDQGESIYEFIAEHKELAAIPRHRTRGGCHLVFFCDDVPPIRKPRSNKPYDKPLFSKLSDTVGAEFYHSDHQNVVFPPSIHPTMFKYVWEVTGAIPTVSWQWIVETFGFRLPGEKEQKPKEEREIPFELNFRGDFKFLDMVKVADVLNLAPELLNAEDSKYAIICPWQSEHTETAQADTSSTVIYQKELGTHWPAFKCLHSHCETREIKDVILWAESRETGIIDRHCTVLRVWEDNQTDVDGKPRILHPQDNELDSVSHTKLGKILGERQVWFDWLGRACILDNIRSGKIYIGEEEVSISHMPATVSGFKELEGIKARGHCEAFCTPGRLRKDEGGNFYFVRESFSTEYCNAALEDPHLLGELPNPHRILTVPFPFLDRTGKKLVYPGPGYDPHFNTYMVKDAPEIDFEMPLNRAKEILAKIHEEFCFLNAQSKVHAFARLITPFARGLLGFVTRVPLWIYRANRPRAGKDYLAMTTILVYEGIAAEDSPIDKQSEETGKRIMSAARNGRRFMHFSNCAGNLDDVHLTQAITNERITARRLGSNEASSDLSVPNTMELSISGNIGLTYSEDIDERSRQIFLAYFEEEANGRKFKNPFLHRSVREHRGDVLSAIAALFGNWERQGMPLGRDVFTTYPGWAEIVGGVMEVNELGNPCLPFKDDTFNVKGDQKTEAMTAVYEVCHNVHGDAWIKKDAIYSTIHEASQDTEDDSGIDALNYYCPIKEDEKAQANRLRLGHALAEYNLRILDGIQLRIDRSSLNRGRWAYRFAKIRETGPDVTASKESCDKPENASKTPEKAQNPVTSHELSRSDTSTRDDDFSKIKKGLS